MASIGYTEAPEPRGPARPIALGADGHALSRYIERWCSSEHPREARLRLEAALPQAIFLEREDGTDQTIWRLPEGALVVVDPHGVVRTVLPRGAAKQRREGERPDVA